VFRYAMSFDGDDYVQAADIDLEEFTIEAGFYLVQAAWPSPLWRAVVSKGWAYDEGGVAGLYVGSPRNIACYAREITGRVPSIGAALDLLHVWKHVVCTYRPNAVALYIDGELVGTASVLNPFAANDLPWEIGRDPLQPFRILPKSMVVLVRLYSRALTDDEIKWNYRYPWNPVRNGLVLWLHAHPDYVKDIDGDGILEWVDLSGNNNHGKIYGAQLVELIRAPAR
jgi:hypothetical protein